MIYFVLAGLMTYLAMVKFRANDDMSTSHKDEPQVRRFADKGQNIEKKTRKRKRKHSQR